MIVKTIGKYAYNHSQLPPSRCGHDAANRKDAIGEATEMTRGSLRGSSFISINWHKPPNMTNCTSTDVTFGGASCSRIIEKQENCHSTTQADKQINEEMLQSTILCRLIWSWIKSSMPVINVIYPLSWTRFIYKIKTSIKTHTKYSTSAARRNLRLSLLKYAVK